MYSNDPRLAKVLATLEDLNNRVLEIDLEIRDEDKNKKKLDDLKKNIEDEKANDDLSPEILKLKSEIKQYEILKEKRMKNSFFYKYEGILSGSDKNILFAKGNHQVKDFTDLNKEIPKIDIFFYIRLTGSLSDDLENSFKTSQKPHILKGDIDDLSIFKYSDLSSSEEKDFLLSLKIKEINQKKVLTLAEHKDKEISEKFKGSLVKYEWIKKFLLHHKSINIMNELNKLNNLSDLLKTLKTNQLNYFDEKSKKIKYLNEEVTHYTNLVWSLHSQKKKKDKYLSQIGELEKILKKIKKSAEVSDELSNKKIEGREKMVMCKVCGGDGGVRQGCKPCRGKGFILD